MRFMHDQTRIDGEDTPQSVSFSFEGGNHICSLRPVSCVQLGLEDGDQVDAMIMQTGGRA